MLFSEPVFLFLFLPIVILIYFAAGARWRNVFLAAAGLLFYFVGEKFLVLILIYSIVVNWALGLLIGAAAVPGRKKLLLILGIAANLAPLAVYKYAGFAADSANVLLSAAGAARLPHINSIIPLGLSFFTFQAMSYLIDIYKNELRPQKNIVTFSVYLAFFAHLVAGPIVRYRDVAAALAARTVTRGDLAEGSRRFIIGLGKKRLIADTLAMRADRIFSIRPEHLTTPVAWLGAVCYMLQIYFDFSGYSDMAIGLARMFGFRFLENFDYPYIARNMGEFWRRWHISLSTWFRDYVYIPLGGNRVRPARVYFNLIAVFALCGLWHGARWGFIAWGIYHGALMMLERAGLSAFLRKRAGPLAHVYVLLAVMAGWVFFRADTLLHAVRFLTAMAGFADGSAVRVHISLYWGNDLFLALAAGALGATPLFPWLAARLGRAMENSAPRAALLRTALAAANLAVLALVLLVSIMSIAGETYRPFLYSRF